jgi:hypothetical protein
VTVCSLEALAAAEPLSGTAPYARAWIVIEAPGPWGHDAVADSRLPDPVRTNLLAAKAAGVSVLLARHPDRPERAGQRERNVWVARSVAGGMLLRHGVLADLMPLAAWDMTAIGEGSLPALGSVTLEPLLLVCTHSKRDRCCAVNGRALLTSLREAATPEQRARIWECSHVGGHRFAPVTLSLPSGAVHGRLDTADAAALLRRHEEGRVVIEHLRGRSGLLAPCQVAAGAVRVLTGADGVDDLDVLRVVDDRAVPASGGVVEVDVAQTEVRHRDGRAWRVEVHRVPLERARAESCGKEPVAGAAWVAREVTPVAPWQ